MEHKLNFLTFWAVNDRLDIERMKRQIDSMKKMGFQGTVFHPRYYPGIPAYMSREYLDILSQVILYAKQEGMQFWIYDENGWPSGSADGKVLERFPDSRCQWIEYEGGKMVWRETRDFNTFDRAEMKYFVEVIYDGYRQGLLPEAFEYVTGFFSDEVGFLNGHGVSISHGGIPWCEEVRERYQELYHEDVTEKLELLFTEGEGYRQVRYRYWQILTDILSEAFYQNVNDWCLRHGKRYTAHLKAEENLFFQTSCSGSACWNLKNVNVPAVDALERYPGNHYYPRIASSLAKQFSDGEALAEALGGSGWGLGPADLEAYVDWLAESGINNFVFHLWQYNRSSASVRDWPPNIPMGLTWQNMVPEVFDRLKKRWDKKVGRPARVLIVAPARGVMASFHPGDAVAINEHNGDGTPLTESGKISLEFNEFIEQCYDMGMEYDVTEERIVEEYGRIQEGKLRIGNAVYHTVIEGQGCLWEKEELIRNMSASHLLRRQEEFIWSFADAGENQLLIENMDSRIPLRFDRPVFGMFLRILDPVRNVTVMGKEQALSNHDETGWYYRISDDAAKEAFSRKELWIAVTVAEEKEPFVFLKGDFLVKSETPYTEKDCFQKMTEGGFYLEERSQMIPCHDLLEAGYPFCDSSVTAECLAVAGAEGQIKIGRIYGDGAGVWVDHEWYGHVWGEPWEITGLTEGIHHIRLELFPSTYNSLGPHHHMDGDRRLTSPAQYAGIKNFADSAAAPECTRVPQWHFKKFGMGRPVWQPGDC